MSRMVAVNKGWSKEQKKWAQNYYGSTSFPPLLQSPDQMFNDFAKSNIDWFEDFSSDALNQITSDVPRDEEDAS